MCRHPITLRNPAYRDGALSGVSLDSLAYTIPPVLVVPCGHCDECVRSRCNDWSLRLGTELERPLSPGARNIFVTLTLSDEFYNPDVRPSVYLRRFFERFRQTYHKPLKHWFSFEYGSNPYCTHRLHFHGILFDCALSNRELRELWHYGRIHVGDYCNTRTAKYITKYIMKSTALHYNLPSYWKFSPIIHCSAGIGSYLVETSSAFLRRLGRSFGKYYFRGFNYRIPSYYLRKVMSSTDMAIRRLYAIATAPPPTVFRGREYATVIDAMDARDLYNKLTAAWTYVKPRIDTLRNISAIPEDFSFDISFVT